MMTSSNHLVCLDANK